MNDINNQNGNTEGRAGQSPETALDDEKRVKVLSPTALVIKRFLRNRLAIIGLVIIVSMFVFAFFGGLLSPYSEAQIFYTYENSSKDYASASYSASYNYTAAEGVSFSPSAQSAFILAVNSGQTTFTSGDVSYTITQEGKAFYSVEQLSPVASGPKIKGSDGYYFLKPSSDDFTLTAEFSAAFTAAVDGGLTSFDYSGSLYYVIDGGKTYSAAMMSPACVTSQTIYDMYDSAQSITYEFRLAAERALASGEKTFAVGEASYTMKSENNVTVVYKTEGGSETPFTNITDLVITPASSDVVLSIEFKEALTAAVEGNQASFTYTDADGNEVEYLIERDNTVFTVTSDADAQVIDRYDSPSSTHFLGTDGNGMDLMTRLMYGGRISLMIGFIVVILEVFIGVIIGGVSGYFGKWVDQLFMRLVDIFNCIPTLPLFIILGSVMETMDIPSKTRIFYLMILLGLLGWTGIARVTRGQILSLREQEFMTAAEATGLSVSRRIFRHLVPNVIPQLIVYATMGLGDVILMEATLSFLGLGVKFPFASWGNIVNAVNDSYVLTNFWFVWIPAGFLILLTVLGFNFIGDGLRDAFDPKMKR